jgi:hypothetical protein
MGGNQPSHRTGDAAMPAVVREKSGYNIRALKATPRRKSGDAFHATPDPGGGTTP